MNDLLLESTLFLERVSIVFGRQRSFIVSLSTYVPNSPPREYIFRSELKTTSSALSMDSNN